MLGEYDEHTNEYRKMIDEHFFLTDPEEFSFSHFPNLENEPDYQQWQLLEEPITLEQFNRSPHLFPMFFDLGLELVDNIPTPWVVQNSGVIRIKSWDVIQYKVGILLNAHKLVSIFSVQTVWAE